MNRPSNAEPPAPGTNALAGLVHGLAEMTGYPPELLLPDADWQRDLEIRPDEMLRLLGNLRPELPLDRLSSDLSRLKTLRQVLESLQPAAGQLHVQDPAGPTASSATELPATHAGQTPRVARRRVLEVVDAPWRSSDEGSFIPSGGVLLLGDHAAADHLREAFAARGASVYHVRPSLGLEAALAEIDRLPAQPAISSIFLLNALDGDDQCLASAEQWRQRRERALELPLLALQRWRRRLTAEQLARPTAIVAATRLGGDFAAGETGCLAEGGWMAGMLKALHVELSRQRQPVIVKVCDFAAADAPRDIARGLLRELAEASDDVEVGLGAGRRRLLRSVEQPIDSLPQVPVARGTSWVITGGARGVTAEVAIELGLRFGLKLHLIGSSQEPKAGAPWHDLPPDGLPGLKRAIVRQAIAERKSPEKQWDRVKRGMEIEKNLDRMRRLGLDACYHCCDLSDWERLEHVLDAIRKRSGPIAGIVHGAGYARSSRLELLDRDHLGKTIAAKLDGAVALMRLTRDDPLRYFIGFGSISGRYGGNGLSDYAAANEMLAKLCAAYRQIRPQCATTCMQWQSWDEVGMAVRPDTSVGSRSLLKMNFMPTAEGTAHVCDELSAGLPRAEVLIDDGEFQKLIAAMEGGSPTGPRGPAASIASDRPLVNTPPGTSSAIVEIGDWRVESVTCGRFLLDGGVMYGMVPKTVWQAVTPADAQNRLPFAIRFLLARSRRHCVLIDTGQGDKLAPLDRKAHALEPGPAFLELLAERGVQPGDVDAVIFSHLHWDHAGGATQFDAERRLVPTFPNATYFVNRDEWEDAAGGAPELAGSYAPHNFRPLEQSGQLVLTEGDEEILPGLWTRVTGGHTRGHQSILFASSQAAALFLGDICPAVTHLRRMWCTAYDVHPAETRRRKAELLGEAAAAGWWLLWEHDPRVVVSRVERHGRHDFAAVEPRGP